MHQDIIVNTLLSTLWEQFRDVIVSSDKSRSIKAWRREAGVEELDCDAHNPDLSPIEDLWDQL